MTAVNWKPGQGRLERCRELVHKYGPDLGERHQHLDVRCHIAKISSFDLVNYVTFTAQAALFENGGSLTMAGAFVDSGLVSLNEANTTGTVGVTGDVLAFGNTGALGAGTVALSGGELIAIADETSAMRSHFRELRGSRPHAERCFTKTRSMRLVRVRY